MYAMNQNFNSGDPSSKVPNQILPHVHLVSSFRFASTPNLQPAQALDYLIKGPAIVKDTQPVAWTYFAQPPPDGTVLLTWQPPRMQNNFASDGLVWADPELSYEMPMRNGYTVQALIQKSGFHYQHESVAQHARYRYRILQGPGQIDPNLWIVHYQAADPANRIPASQIQIPREIHAHMQARAQLEAAGQLIRKDFMLADRGNWPQVEFARPAGHQPPYYNPMQPGRAYNQPPPNKKPRQSVNQQRQPIASAMAADTSLEEEENSTQDIFDFITPREISQSRYKQHHEWMEEIFSSPYDVGRILPIDLGLGLMGELAPLTAGLLDAPAGDFPSRDRQDKKDKYEVKSYQKMNADDLKEFEARVAAYTAKEKAELEKMKAAHQKKMADLKRSRTYIKAERRLRDISRTDSSRFLDDDVNKDSVDLVENIVEDLEKSLGVEFDTKNNVVCVEKGGFIEEQRAPPQKAQPVNVNGPTQPNTGNGTNSLMGAIETENSAANLLDQYGSTSLTGTPGANLSIPPIPQPQSQLQSAVATPSVPLVEPRQHPGVAPPPSLQAPSGTDDPLDLDLDVEMSGMTNTEDKGGENEWVMVDQTGGAQQSTINVQPLASTQLAAGGIVATSGVEVDVTGGGMFDTADFGSFDNLVDDSAGDALADYAHVDDNMGLDLVDDSAFGDAFHGTEMHHETTEGDNP